MRDAQPPAVPPGAPATRLARLNSRRLGVGALLGFWGLAILLLVLHVNDFEIGIQNQLWFAVVETMLLGAGCVGTPILALRALGRHLSPSRCGMLATLLFGGSIVYTCCIPAMHPQPAPITATFTLVPLLAGAIHSANAADALTRERDAEARGETRARDSTGFQVRELRASLDERDTEIMRLREELEDAHDAAGAAFEAGARATAQACQDAILARTEELEGVEDMPLAGVRQLRAKVGRALRLEPAPAQPLHIVPSREADHNTHGHRTDGIGG